MSSTIVNPSKADVSSGTAAARPLRVALVGCGAVAKASLLPVLAGHPGVEIRALVDRDAGRAASLAEAYTIGRSATDLRDVLDEIDGVVLATPPAHHAPTTIALASQGKHVFVEKPMATTLVDAEAMVAAAERHGVVLGVGLYRRMLPAVQLIAALIERREYGRPLAVDADEGGAYGWPLATLDVLTRAHGGGGVLIDIGSHVIDVLFAILPGPATLVSYEDNARGGIETDCLAHFSLKTDGGEVPVRLELSRTRDLGASIRVRCERATLEITRGNFTQVAIHATTPPGRTPAPCRVTAEWQTPVPYVGYEAFRAEIDDWLTAIQTGRPPVLSGRSVVPVVRLIDQCYRERRGLEEPWTDHGLSKRPGVGHPVSRRRVLVTGAGGFLGGRTVEVLRERHGWDVVALVREPKGAARLARWPQAIALGDVCSPSDMRRAVEGCDAVVHCAVGTSWKAEEVRAVTVDGTRTVAEAALAAGVRRFVHISTMFVHRRDGLGTLDEGVSLEPPAADSYGRNKLAAEQAIQRLAARGLGSVILRPTRIYGPFSRTFTVRPLQALAAGEFSVGGDPDVPANMVYVDNVVDAIARALDAPDTLHGSAYLITDPEQVSLKEFYEAFAREMGAGVPVVADRRAVSTDMNPGLVKAWASGFTAIARSPELRALVRRILDTDPVGTFPRWLWDRSPKAQGTLLRAFGSDAAVVYRPAAVAASRGLVYYGETGRVSSAKAERELGFDGLVPRDTAVALTLDWARYARLIPAAIP